MEDDIHEPPRLNFYEAGLIRAKDMLRNCLRLLTYGRRRFISLLKIIDQQCGGFSIKSNINGINPQNNGRTTNKVEATEIPAR